MGVRWCIPAFAQATLTVDVDKPGPHVSPTLWGIFFEDLTFPPTAAFIPNSSATGPSEDAARPEYWRLLECRHGNSGMALILPNRSTRSTARSLRVNVDGTFTLENEGYWGMTYVKGRQLCP